jgi:hypothetical protein
MTAAVGFHPETLVALPDAAFATALYPLVAGG